MRDLCARILAQRKLPVENRLGSGDCDPTSNKIKVMTMKVSKGLECPVAALPGVGHMAAAGADEKEAARVLMWWLRGRRRGCCLQSVATAGLDERYAPPTRIT